MDGKKEHGWMYGGWFEGCMDRWIDEKGPGWVD